MSNVVNTEVQDLHTPIPTTDLTKITTFISDAEDIVKAKLSPWVEMWTDSNEPGIIKVIVKHMAAWTELKRLYGSQVDEFHEWVRDFRDFPMNLIEQLIKHAKDNLGLPPGINPRVSTKVRSNTKNFEKIFTLESEFNWVMHPDDADKRYGEN